MSRKNMFHARPRYFRPCLEVLEDRQLLSASAFSNLGNVPVQFNLQANGHLQETVGKSPTDLGVVQGLYQGKDNAGHQVAYELVNNTLKEFTPTGWISLGAANRVVADGVGDVFFTQGSTLDLATGVPGHYLAVLSNVQGLTTSGTQASVQIGSYFKVDLTAKVDPTSGATTLSFSNVQMNVGQFAAGFLSNAVTNLQSFTKPLESLADAFEKPLIPGWGFTTIWLMQQLGYGQQASEAKTFADTIHEINNISASVAGSDSWVNLGSFTAEVKSPTQLVTLSSSPNSAAGITSQLGGSASTALAQLQSIPGVTVALNDPQQLMKLITGENTTLFSYTLSVPNAISVTTQQPLAAIPISPVTLTELDVDANFGLNLSAAATFGFDTSGFQGGNFAQGFFIQNAHATASLTAGLSGLLNEANLAGYQVTGAVTGSITASLKGADSSGKLYLDQIMNGAIAFSSPNWNFGLSAKALGPQQMLTLAIQQYGPYLKTLVGTDAQIAANILNGNGVSFTNIAEALGTLYGIPPQTTAGVLKKLNATTDQIAGALKSEYSYGAIASALAGGINGLTFNNIAQALNSAGASPSAIASALWNTSVTQYFKNPQLSWVAGALYSVVPNASSVAQTLNHLFPGNYGAIASALAGGINGLTFNNIAQALNSAGASPSAIASALWNTSVTQYFKNPQLSWVAGALQTVTSNWSSVAQDMANAGITSLSNALSIVGSVSGGGGILGQLENIL